MDDIDQDARRRILTYLIERYELKPQTVELTVEQRRRLDRILDDLMDWRRRISPLWDLVVEDL